MSFVSNCWLCVSSGWLGGGLAVACYRLSGGFSTLCFTRSAGGGLPLQFANAFLHLLARLERDDKLLWYVDFCASPRVASLACRPSLNFEDSEIPQLNSF